MKKLFLGIMLLLVLPFSSFVAYRSIQMIEKNCCYARLANQFRVSPTYTELGDSFLIQINQILKKGLTRQETIHAISGIAPVKVVDAGFGGDRSQILLEVCKITENNFYYLIRYQDEKFVDIELFIPD